MLSFSNAESAAQPESTLVGLPITLIVSPFLTRSDDMRVLGSVGINLPEENGQKSAQLIENFQLKRTAVNKLQSRGIG